MSKSWIRQVSGAIWCSFQIARWRLADRLLRAGHAVTVLDNLSKGRRQTVPPKAEFVQVDTGDQASVDHAFRTGSFNAVMHFAAAARLAFRRLVQSLSKMQLERQTPANEEQVAD